MDIQLERLIEISHRAYERARHDVFDSLTEGSPLDADSLTERQRRSLMAMRTAEDDLTSYRRRRDAA
jgi:hypothetical protein